MQKLTRFFGQLKGILLFDSKSYKEVYENKNSLPAAFLLALTIYVLVNAASFRVLSMGGIDSASSGVACDINRYFPAPLTCYCQFGEGYTGDRSFMCLVALLVHPLVMIIGLVVYAIVLSLLSRLSKGEKHDLQGYISLVLYSQTPALLGVLAIFGQQLKDAGMALGFIWTLACVIKATKDTTNLSLFKASAIVIVLSFIWIVLYTAKR